MTIALFSRHNVSGLTVGLSRLVVAGGAGNAPILVRDELFLAGHATVIGNLRVPRG